MKKLGLLIVLMAWNFGAFSQTYKPQILIEGTDTSFRFSLSQSKGIAKMLSNGFYCDSIQVLNKQTTHVLDSMVAGYKKQTTILRNIIDNDNGLYNNEVALNKSLTKDLNKSQKSLKRQKVYKKIAFGVGVVVGGTAVYLVNRIVHKLD